MREIRPYGSVRGAGSNARPYRDHAPRYDTFGPAARISAEQPAAYLPKLSVKRRASFVAAAS